MKLTPLEIKQQTFEKSLRGYDVSEVQAFLSLLSNEWEHLINSNKELESKIEALNERVKHYERVEEALHETLQTAKESAEQKLAGAKLEAQSSLEKAELQADAIIREAHQNRQNIRQSVLRLIDKKEEIIRSMQAFLDNNQESLNKFNEDAAGIFTIPEEENLDNIPAPKKMIELDTETKDEEGDEVDLGSHAYPPGVDRLDDILDEID